MLKAHPDKLKRLGALIVQRRVQQKMKTKIALSEKTGISTRVLGDVESGKRQVSDTTYATIELAIGWPAGTIGGYLEGWGSILDDEPEDGTVTPAGQDAGVGTIKARKPADMTDEDFKRLLAEYEEEIEWKLNRAARER